MSQRRTISYGMLVDEIQVNLKEKEGYEFEINDDGYGGVDAGD